MQKIQAFLLLPTSNPINDFFKNTDDLVLDKTLVADYLNQLEISLDVAYKEKVTDVYYSESNIQQFLSGFMDFENEYLSNTSGRLSDILQSAENWEDNSQQKSDSYYDIWKISDRQAVNLHELHTFSEIAERICSQITDKIVLIDHKAIHSNDSIVIMISGLLGLIEFSNVPVFTVFHSTKTIEQLETWFSNNRQPRIFNLNPKHGENGVGARANKGEKVSLLLCSQNQASELLRLAKGDKRISKELFAFDTNHKKFIVFKDDNTIVNSYHGYHVDNENEVPHKIRNTFEK